MLSQEESIYVNDVIYVLERKLGGRTLNNVYLGHIPPTRFPVAVKIVEYNHTDNDLNEALFEQCTNEIKHNLLLRNNSRVVSIYDYQFDLNKQKLTMVMELADDDLSHSIKHNSVCINLNLWHSMVLAVDEIHTKGIIHADIKPSNFVFGKDGYVKLIDFGFSLPLEQFPTFKNYRGTYRYVSPEILGIKPFGTFSTKSDVWALGSILYEIVYGRSFISEELQTVRKETLMLQQMYNIPFLPILDQDLFDLLHRCLDLFPNDRYSTKQILEHPFIVKMFRSRY
ncbi:hypothetical protein ACOME3_003662 [Neoechinorhynchus agilis]